MLYIYCDSVFVLQGEPFSASGYVFVKRYGNTQNIPPNLSILLISIRLVSLRKRIFNCNVRFVVLKCSFNSSKASSIFCISSFARSASSWYTSLKIISSYAKPILFLTPPFFLLAVFIQKFIWGRFSTHSTPLSQLPSLLKHQNSSTIATLVKPLPSDRPTDRLSHHLTIWPFDRPASILQLDATATLEYTLFAQRSLLLVDAALHILLITKSVKSSGHLRTLTVFTGVSGTLLRRYQEMRRLSKRKKG